MTERTDNAFWASLLAEYRHPFNGWDFSHLDGRMTSIRANPTWDYTETVIGAMKQAQTLLDMHTGGGEVLAQLLARQPVQQVYATEGYAPNVVLAYQRLISSGVSVSAVHDGHLPFAEKMFDLVINRHGSYDPSEVLRVLKSGQMFITQQVGDQTNRLLHALLKREKVVEHPWNLRQAVGEMEAVGGRVMESKEEYFSTRFHDVGAIVFYLKAVPWEVPDFSVEKYREELLAIHDLLQRKGYLDVPFHAFFFLTRKP